MEKGTFDRIFELSHRRKGNLVTPLILEYYTLESYSLDEGRIIEIMEEEYKRKSNL